MKTARPAVAFAVATAGIAVFSGMDAIMKGLVLDIGVYNALLWRSLAGVAIAGALHLARRPAWPARATLRVHALRGMVTTGMAALFFWGLARVPMAQAIALTFIAPLIALFFARVMLGEPISRRAIGGSVAASIGVLLILSGQARVAAGSEAMMGAAAILCSAVCYAYNIILMRRQSLLADAIEVAFFQSAMIALLLVLAPPVLTLFATVLAAPMLAPVAPVLALAAPFLAVVVPAAHHVPPLLLAAVLAVTSLLLLSWAYARAEANYLAPVEYTAFLWAGALGWLVFGEAVSPLTVAGAMLIGAACIYAARRRAVPMGNLEAAA